MFKLFFIGSVLLVNMYSVGSVYLAYQNDNSTNYAVSRPVASVKQDSEANKTSRVQEINYGTKIGEMGIVVQTDDSYVQYSLGDKLLLDNCNYLTYKTLSLFPVDLVDTIDNITFSFDPDARRGLGGGSKLILRCKNISDSEYVSVLIHELGHIQDTGLFKGNFLAGNSTFKDGNYSVYKDDLSLSFYKLSFLSESSLRSYAKDVDFVSKYAMSDPFEDFAETFNFYFLHGSDFRNRAEKNLMLAKKYDYMKYFVFSGREFGLDSKPLIDSNVASIYDTTTLAYDFKILLD